MTTVAEQKAELLANERKTQLRGLAHQEIELDKRLKEIEDAYKKLSLGAIEVKQRIAEIEKMDTIEQADVNAVVAQVSKLRNILLPGPSNTPVTSSMIVSGSITVDKLQAGVIGGDRLIR